MVLAITLTMGNVIAVNAEEYVDAEYKHTEGVGKAKSVIQCENYDLQCGKTIINGDISQGDNLYDLKDGIMSILFDDATVLKTFYLGDSVVSSEGNVYSSDSYNVGAGIINLNDVIMAENDISLSGSEVNCENAIVYSENGDINFYCGNAVVNGIIYAPNGTVQLQGSNININGLIIAKNVIVRAGEFNASYNEDIERYVKNLDFFEETNQQSLVVTQKDNKIILSWSEYNFDTNTDVYVRYDESDEFICIGNTTAYEYILNDRLFAKCDFRIVSTVLGEEIESNIVTVFIDEDGVLNEENIDSDYDLIPDGYEIWDLKSDPYNNDTDKDGIDDGYEALVLNSNPCVYESRTDIDNDGISDLEEYIHNTNPLLKDTDFDGLNDNEDDYATKPIIGIDSYVDINIEKNVGRFDIENKYIIDGIEHEYVYNYIIQETTYSRIGDDCTVKFIDNNGNVQSVVNNMIDEDESVQDVVIYDYSKEGYLNSFSNNGVTYEFEYNENYQMTKSYVNGIELINYEYGNNNISKMKLGNGKSESYVNDGKGNIIEKYIDDKLIATYEYDEKNNLIKSTDLENGINFEYLYNEDELSEVKINDNVSIVYEYGENELNTFIKCDDIIFSQKTNYYENACSIELANRDIYTTTQSTENTYKESIFSNGNVIFSNVYEVNEGFETGEVAQRIEGMQDIEGNEYRYEYDKNGNIIEIYLNGQLEKEYDYNIYGELIREYNYVNQEMREYSYNKRGNIERVMLTDLVDETKKNIHCYEYNDAQWRDLLTSIDGENVIYDEIGNPIEYGKADITWNAQLKIESVTIGDEYFEYKYDANGNRIAKIVNGEETRYITDGNCLLGKEVSGDKLWYIYNDFGKVIGFSLNDESFYFQKDNFNSVKNIINAEGDIVCAYEYDAWGNILSVEGDLFIASINDYRYQSYIYDEETGFYYLESRYYDPNNYRFINADSIFSGTNLFMYCNNSPTNYYDPNGKKAIESVYGNNIISVSDWGYSGVGYKKLVSDQAGGYFYRTSNGKKVYFNCYLWALNQMKNDTNYGDPGAFDNKSSTTIKWKDSVSTVYDLVKSDVKYMGYGFKAASSPNASVSSGQRLIALRTTTSSSQYWSKYGGWDYHFMKKIGSTWTYKGGRSGRIFEVSSKYTPSSASWDIASWDTGNKRWYVCYSNAYTSTVKYFILTY